PTPEDRRGRPAGPESRPRLPARAGYPQTDPRATLRRREASTPTMKEHVETITNLLLGAAYADKRLEGDEVAAIEALLCKLMGTEELPAAQADQMRAFSPAAFDAAAAAASL